MVELLTPRPTDKSASKQSSVTAASLRQDARQGHGARGRDSDENSLEAKAKRERSGRRSSLKSKRERERARAKLRGQLPSTGSSTSGMAPTRSLSLTTVIKIIVALLVMGFLCLLYLVPTIDTPSKSRIEKNLMSMKSKESKKQPKVPAERSEVEEKQVAAPAAVPREVDMEDPLLVTHVVWFDMTIGDEDIGRVDFQRPAICA